MSWFYAEQATVLNGSLEVVITPPASGSRRKLRGVSSRDGVLLVDATGVRPLEIHSTEETDTTQKIILVRPYEGVNYTDQRMLVMPISGAFQEATAAIQNLLDRGDVDGGLNWMNTWLTSPADTIAVPDSDGNDVTIGTYSFYQTLYDEAVAQTGADVIQTGEDRVATGQDLLQTTDDRRQTGEDRVATGQDALQTGQDLVQTTEDRVATGEDRVATGLDRVATGEDVVQTTADAVQTGLDRVATGADVVQTGQDVVQTTAGVIQTGEDRVATGQDLVQTTADVIQTGEDLVATGQDLLQTTDDRRQTGEDRVATGQDVITATAEANRSRDEADRAQGIANNLDDTYRDAGGWDNTQGSLPAKPTNSVPTMWVALATAAVGVIDFNEGEGLLYSPALDPNYPSSGPEVGFYKRSGQPLAPLPPTDIEILEDLIMQQTKVIRFKTLDGLDDTPALRLDADDDLVLGHVGGYTPYDIAPFAVVRQLGLAAEQGLFHIRSFNPDGSALEFYNIITNELGEVARDADLEAETLARIAADAAQDLIIGGKENTGVAASLVSSHRAEADATAHPGLNGRVTANASNISSNTAAIATKENSGVAASLVSSHNVSSSAHNARFAAKENTGVAASLVNSHNTAAGRHSAQFAGKENTGVAASQVASHRAEADATAHPSLNGRVNTAQNTANAAQARAAAPSSSTVVGGLRHTISGTTLNLYTS